MEEFIKERKRTSLIVVKYTTLLPPKAEMIRSTNDASDMLHNYMQVLVSRLQ
jgi:hypothetical protein